MSNAKHLVIVGGGFAGATLVRKLSMKLPAQWCVWLVSEESYTTFHPMLPEAVGASIFPEHVVAPLRELQRPGMNARFVMGRVTQVDVAARQLSCQTLAGDTVLPWDHLVLACGNRARLDFMPGMAEFALPLKTIGDALEIRNLCLRRLAQIELTADPAQRKVLGHFAVIGGGFSGVEVAGELIDCLRSIRTYYPGVAADDVGVTIVHDQKVLLPELPSALGMAAERSLRARGVAVMLETRASEIFVDGIALVGGTRIHAASIICTIGTRPNPLIEKLAEDLQLPLERGRLVTDGQMRVAGQTGVWALGDCAQVPNLHDQKPAPPTAQFAVREAMLLARNLIAEINGRPLSAFNYRARGMLAAIGHMKGVAQVFGVNVSGLPAWLLWRAYYLSQMPTLGRKVRIFVEWTWGMFFPADITHLRFRRSRDLDKTDV